MYKDNFGLFETNLCSYLFLFNNKENTAHNTLGLMLKKRKNQLIEVILCKLFKLLAIKTAMYRLY